MENRKSPGRIVVHLKTKRQGRTFNQKGIINGKVPVYFESGKPFVYEEKAILCSPENLKVIGFID